MATTAGLQPAIKAATEALLRDSRARAIGAYLRSGRRSTALQVILYARYRAGRGPVAARPGTSKHERGLAVDINARDYRRLEQVAAEYGLRRTVPSEAWHFELTGRNAHATVAPAPGLGHYTGPDLRSGSRGQQVVVWQFLLVAVHKSQISCDGSFGPQTVRATKGFQRSKGIRATGGVGPQTKAAMNGAVDWINTH